MVRADVYRDGQAVNPIKVPIQLQGHRRDKPISTSPRKSRLSVPMVHLEALQTRC